MTLLIVGGAGGALIDANKAIVQMRPHKFDAVLAINDAIASYPRPIDYAATLHPDKLGSWFDRRAKNQLPGPRPEVWSDRNVGVGNIEPDQITYDTFAGSSGLFGVKVGLIEGFRRIVLAGIPMVAARGHIGDDAPWLECVSFRSGWHTNRRLIGPYVRSVSGWTAELLGTPSKAWLTGREQGRFRPTKEEPTDGVIESDRRQA